MTSVTHLSARRRVAALTAAAVALALSIGVPATQAHAADSTVQLASDNPYNWTPRVLDGQVEAIKRVGNTVYVGGDFTQIQAPDDAAPVLNRPYLFAFNATTGAILDSFAAVPSGPVKVLLPDGNGRVYVGGQFTKMNGVTRSHVALVDGTTGARINAFKPSKTNSAVFDLRLRGQQLIVAGSFSTVDSVTRPGIVSLDAATGIANDYLTAQVSGTGWGKGVTTVRKIDITPAGDRLVATGNFNAVNGQTRLQIAMFDLNDSNGTLANWTTTRFQATGTTTGSSRCAKAFDSYMRDIDFSSDGSFFVVVTTGAYRAGTLCDSASRWETYASGDQVETWSDLAGGDTFWSVEVAGSIVYVGGHMRWLNNPYAGDKAGVGAVARDGIGALDSRNGLPLSWNPGRDRGVGLFDFDVTDTELWAGSDTDRWASEYRPRVAGFPLADGTLPEDRTATLPGDVVLLDSPAAGVSQDYRNFDGTSVLGSSSAPAADDWSLARGAVMIDGTVYTGWADSSTVGSFRARSFDGTNFGPSTTLELYANGLTTDSRGFGVDIPRITGMFYDRPTGRLYYTLKPNASNNSGGFFYRYFTPESGVVGAQRFTALNGSLMGANSNGTTYPRGMFRDGGKVYFVDSTGALKNIDFVSGTSGSAGGVTGSATTVNNAVDWRANASFVSTLATTVGPNTDPTADLTAQCAGLVCTFDASESSDPDGQVTGYSFDFGDGQTAESTSGIVEHTYSAGDTYSASVTVTDNRGGTGMASTSVSPAPIVSAIAFRTSGEYSTASSSSRHTFAVPNQVEEGDRLVLVTSSNGSGIVADPAGWTRLGEELDGDTRSVVFTKVADTTDAGVDVTLNWTSAARVVMSFAAYSGVAGAPDVTGAIETSGSGATHTTPGTTVPVDGAWVLSYWSDKSSQTTTWTAPAGQVVRALPPLTTPSGTSRVSALLTDDGAPSAAGPRAGLTATSDASSAKGTFFTIVLTPAS